MKERTNILDDKTPDEAIASGRPTATREILELTLAPDLLPVPPT